MPRAVVSLDVVSRASSAISIKLPHGVAGAARSILKMRAPTAGTWIDTHTAVLCSGGVLLGLDEHPPVVLRFVVPAGVALCSVWRGPVGRYASLRYITIGSFSFASWTSCPRYFFFTLNMYQVETGARTDGTKTQHTRRHKSVVKYLLLRVSAGRLVTRLSHNWPKRQANGVGAGDVAIN